MATGIERALQRELLYLRQRFQYRKRYFFNKFDSSIFAINQAIRKILNLLGVQKYNIYAPDKNALKEYLSNIGFNVNEDFALFDDIVCVKEDKDNKYTLKLNSNLFDKNDKLVEIRDKATLEYGNVAKNGWCYPLKIRGR